MNANQAETINLQKTQYARTVQAMCASEYKYFSQHLYWNYTVVLSTIHLLWIKQHNTRELFIYLSRSKSRSRCLWPSSRRSPSSATEDRRYVSFLVVMDGSLVELFRTYLMFNLLICWKCRVVGYSHPYYLTGFHNTNMEGVSGLGVEWVWCDIDWQTDYYLPSLNISVAYPPVPPVTSLPYLLRSWTSAMVAEEGRRDSREGGGWKGEIEEREW